ncbi:uncharacterized protein LOC106168283 [Lingula anatina]|uniref:Uncharacterized protein LOC106168283 n=1 Tax=Lingula anatina TaxID=7574 RepID=A0A1S3IXP3_LINAN|nr:uncharacterized protein LOC106168283 [Lingula anatina]|eukprot:XP_013402746.2 uncharacterized protein LOC106168283 [Lingula anatina]
MPSENCGRQSYGNSDCAVLENSSLVSETSDTSDRASSVLEEAPATISTSLQRSDSSLVSEPEPISMPLIRDSLKEQRISESAINIIMRSWRDSSHKQYRTYLNKWRVFCFEREIDPIRPPVGLALDFLVELVNTGLSFSALNTARSALSAVIIIDAGVPFGALPIVKRFLKAVFLSKPSSPRYQCIWDVKTVLDYISTMHKVTQLSLKDLSLKLIILMALTSAQRGQTLHLLNMSNLHIGKASYTFTISKHVKQSRPGVSPSVVRFSAYPVNRKLCVVTCLTEYLSRTQILRGEEDSLFISYTRPHKAVGRETISRWIKVMLARAGIDISIFKAHSTRAAATSAANRAAVPLNDILSKAGWSNASTFARFYNKPIINVDHFANRVLDSVGTNK